MSEELFVAILDSLMKMDKLDELTECRGMPFKCSSSSVENNTNRIGILSTLCSSSNSHSRSNHYNEEQALTRLIDVQTERGYKYYLRRLKIKSISFSFTQRLKVTSVMRMRIRERDHAVVTELNNSLRS